VFAEGLFLWNPPGFNGTLGDAWLRDLEDN